MFFQFSLPEAPHLGESLDIVWPNEDLPPSARFKKMSKEAWEMLGLFPGSCSNQTMPPYPNRPRSLASG